MTTRASQPTLHGLDTTRSPSLLDAPSAGATSTPAPPSPAGPKRIHLIAAFAAVYILWGSTYLAILFTLESLPPLTMAGARFLIAGTILYVWARAKGAPTPKRIEWRSAAIVGAALLLFGNGGVVLAEERIPSGMAALLVSGTPMWMTLFDSIGSRKKPNIRVMFGIAAGITGVALLVGPGQLAGTSSAIDLTGVALVLVASLSWSAGSIYSRRAQLPPSPWLTTGMEMIAGGALLFVVGTTRGELATFDPSAVTAKAALAWVYLIGAGSLLGYTAYIWLLRNTTPARATTYAYVNPMVAVLLGWALAGEQITPRMVIAGAVIVGALVLINGAKK